MDEDIVRASKKLLGYALVFTVFDRDALIHAMKDERYAKVAGNSGINKVHKWGHNFKIDEASGAVTEHTDAAVDYADQIPPCSLIAA